MRLNEIERAAKELGGKLEEVQVARSTAEADLAIEKQWRASLQVKQLFTYLLQMYITHSFFYPFLLIPHELSFRTHQCVRKLKL